MGPQMIDTPQNVWPQMSAPDVLPSMSPVGPQPMIDNHPGPKPLMEEIPDQPPFDIAPVQSSRGRDFGFVISSDLCVYVCVCVCVCALRCIAYSFLMELLFK